MDALYYPSCTVPSILLTLYPCMVKMLPISVCLKCKKCLAYHFSITNICVQISWLWRISDRDTSLEEEENQEEEEDEEGEEEYYRRERQDEAGMWDGRGRERRGGSFEMEVGGDDSQNWNAETTHCYLVCITKTQVSTLPSILRTLNPCILQM